MFLPRTPASLLSGNLDSSIDKSATTNSSSASTSTQPSPRRYGMTRQGANHGAWSQPTTAPASVQVHYHYLAGRYRDLSGERGLGLISSGMPSSSSMATLGGIVEAERDEGDSLEGDARSIGTQLSPNGKARSASNSLRAIAKKSGLKGSSSGRLDDLFLGGMGRDDRRRKGAVGVKGGLADIKIGKGGQGKAAAPHGAKHGSLRSYAEERIKAHELIESRIERATDTGRLKWEARAAMLNNSFPLALLLYTRAAQLGSVSASLHLSHLYSTGITRGNKPVVVLVHRDPLRSLSWALESARLLQHRSSVKAKKRGDSSVWSRGDVEQPAQIVALLARLLRCRQVGLTTAEQVKLPVVRKRKSSKEETRGVSLWEAVCDSMGWLDHQLPAYPQHMYNDGTSRGPDDDDSDPNSIQRLQSRTQVALIEALVASNRWSVGDKEDEETLSKVKSCWRNFQVQLQNEGTSHAVAQGDLTKVWQASEKLIEGKENGREAMNGLIGALNSSLVESTVPVASSPVEPKLAHLESPSKRRAGQLARRKVSLEELMPMDSDSKRLREEALRPSLLKQRSSADIKPTATVLGITASAKTKTRSNRAISLQGNSMRPKVSTSATFNPFQSLNAYSGQVERSALQRVRRPSSVMSDSPSLLFFRNASEESKEETGVTTFPDRSQMKADKGTMTATSSVVSSLWEVAPLHGRVSSGQSATARKRVISLHGKASVAPSDNVQTEGSTTFDYDVDTALRRQLTRRRRGDSNASISTIASMLSTTPSISESMTESQYAKGQFLTPSTSSNINGFDLRLGGAADSLRRIRKASFSDQNNPMKDGPTATPQLTDTLEQLIANSASYRAANKTTNSSRPPTRNRKDSNASMRSLTAFTASNQRQSSRGEMRPPSLYQVGVGRAHNGLAMPAILADRSSAIRSPTLSTSTSFLHAAPTTSTSNQQQARASVNNQSQGALGSLRLLGRQASSQSTQTSKSLSTKGNQSAQKENKAKETLSSPSLPSKEAGVKTPNVSKRSFDFFDPTHSTSATPKSMLSPSPSLSGSIIYTEKHKAKSNGNNDNNNHNSINNNNHNRNHSNNSNNNNNNNNNNNTLDPALAEAEERSGLKTTSTCLICSLEVINAPVSKSGDVFCSRDCRIEMKKRRSSGVTNDKGKGKSKQQTV